MTVSVNPVTLLRAVVKDIRANLPSRSTARIGRCNHLKIEDEDGNIKTVKMPTIINGVELTDNSVTYFVEVDNRPFYLQTIYSIAYTREYENPLIQCVFMYNNYNHHLVLFEANTYKIINNSFVRHMKLVEEDEKAGYKPKKKNVKFCKKK